ncbi:Uncharacterised protein [Mycobacterium tuberculosis]|nr:Uncharacterised protein [Mycobacterium tuberculosis]
MRCRPAAETLVGQHSLYIVKASDEPCCVPRGQLYRGYRTAVSQFRQHWGRLRRDRPVERERRNRGACHRTPLGSLSHATFCSSGYIDIPPTHRPGARSSNGNVTQPRSNRATSRAQRAHCRGNLFTDCQLTGLLNRPGFMHTSLASAGGRRRGRCIRLAVSERCETGSQQRTCAYNQGPFTVTVGR